MELIPMSYEGLSFMTMIPKALTMVGRRYAQSLVVSGGGRWMGMNGGSA